MKWMAMTLVMSMAMGAMVVGCENSDDMNAPTMPANPATDESMDMDMDMSDPAATAPTTQASAAMAVLNQYCAVTSQDKVDPAFTVVHEGKKIGFCCEDCIPAFKKDPAKYLAAMK